MNLYQTETTSTSFLQRLLAVVAFIGLLALPTLAAEQCSDVFARKSFQTGPGWNHKNLRLVTFNAQDFTLYEKPSLNTEGLAPKNEKLTEAAAKTLFETQPDIIVLQEVGNEYSLQKLAELSAHIEYEAVLIQGHDVSDPGGSMPAHYARHIGFLIKKSLNLEYTVTTNLEIPYIGRERNRKFLFDRGLPVLKFFASDSAKPLFAVIGVHNHSIGAKGRFAELKNLEEHAMISVIKKIEDAHGANFPIMAMGDLNQSVNDPLRLTQLKAKMIDSFDALRIGADDPRRITQTYERSNQVFSRQIDAVFISRPLAGHIKRAQPLAFPVNGVSDHNPLLVDINFEGAIP